MTWQLSGFFLYLEHSISHQYEGMNLIVCHIKLEKPSESADSAKHHRRAEQRKCKRYRHTHTHRQTLAKS